MIPTFLVHKSYRAACLGIILFSFFAIAHTAWGAPATYQPLVGIPGLAANSSGGLAAYLNRIYVILIGLGAIIAFLKIAIAGVKWSMSDIVTDKSSAKEDIKGSLLGLAILLIPFIVLKTIYPDLTSLNILGNSSGAKVDLQQPSNSSSNGSGTGNSNSGTTGVSVGQIIDIWNCTFVRRGVAIPGQFGPSGEPVYTPDEYDCGIQLARCASSQYNGTGVLVNNNQQVQCTYYVATVCNPLNGDVCPGTTGGGA